MIKIFCISTILCYINIFANCELKEFIDQLKKNNENTIIFNKNEKMLNGLTEKSEQIESDFKKTMQYYKDVQSRLNIKESLDNNDK